jgi:hypothetical protein
LRNPAWRASTEWIFAAATKTASAVTLGAAPAYAATPVLERIRSAAPSGAFQFGRFELEHPGV